MCLSLQVPVPGVTWTMARQSRKLAASRHTFHGNRLPKAELGPGKAPQERPKPELDPGSPPQAAAQSEIGPREATEALPKPELSFRGPGNPGLLIVHRPCPMSKSPWLGDVRRNLPGGRRRAGPFFGTLDAMTTKSSIHSHHHRRCHHRDLPSRPSIAVPSKRTCCNSRFPGEVIQ